ncbi:Homoserine kinase [Balamuthia mandrillaris]
MQPSSDGVGYTALSAEEAAEILSRYQPHLGSFVAISAIAGGNANSNYKLQTTTGNYLLKVCDEKPKESLDLQVRALLRMKEHHFPTCFPHPLSLDEPTLCVLLHRGSRVVIYDFLQGNAGTTASMTAVMAEELGAAVAALHNIAPIEGLPPFPMGTSAIYPFLEEVKGTAFADHDFVRFLSSTLEELKEAVEDPSLPQGMVHGDIFPDNVIFSEEGRVVGIVDFEEVCLGPTILDVGMTIVGCCYPKDNKLDEELAKTFLTAYRKVRPLSDAELRMLPAFIKYAALTIAFWRFRQFNLRYPNEQRKNDHEPMVERIESLPSSSSFSS